MVKTATWITAKLLVILVTFTVFNSSSAFSTGTFQNKIKEEKTAGFSEPTLTVLNPQGFVKKEKDLAPRLETLKGKKIAMWLSATADKQYAGRGAELYSLLEKALRKEYADIQIVRCTELPMKYSPEEEVVKAIVATQPDAVVAGFGG